MPAGELRQTFDRYNLSDTIVAERVRVGRREALVAEFIRDPPERFSAD
jgi:hypothetical protein